jgi:hypothetical protein
VGERRRDKSDPIDAHLAALHALRLDADRLPALAISGIDRELADALCVFGRAGDDLEGGSGAHSQTSYRRFESYWGRRCV